MKTKIIFIFAVLMMATVASYAQIRDKISTNPSDLKFEKAQEFAKIEGYFDYWTSEEGMPELPVYKVSYVLPIDAKVIGITFLSKEKRLLKQDVYIYPVQSPRKVGDTEPIDFIQPDKKVYDSNIPYPSKAYDIESDDIIQGYHVVTFRIYPFEYIPQSRILNYYPDLEYTVRYESNRNTDVPRPVVQSILRAELCKRFVGSIVQNPSDVEKFGSNVQNFADGKTIIPSNIFSLRSQTQTKSILNDIVPEYIIIACDSLKSALQPLSDWKTKKGIFTIIVTTEEINSQYSGSDLTEKIRNYLTDASNKWGAGLYVLLGGNINTIPSRYVKGVNDALHYPSDKYYSTSTSWSIYSGNVFNGNNSNSLINIVGRILVDNRQEVAAYVTKVIAYEKTIGLGDLNYLKNNLYADAYMEYNSQGGLVNFFHSNIKNYVGNYVPSIINNKFICDNANCLGGSRYTTSGSTCSNGQMNGDIELNRNNFLSCINTGADLGIGKFHFIYHLDHSSTTSIGISSKDKGQSINRADMDNLINGTSYQIMMSGGCHPANFQYDCFGWHYLINPNGGGVAFIGNTDVGYQNEHYQLKKFLDVIYSTTIHRYDIGGAFQNVTKNTSPQNWRLHLLGDPEMQIWTNVPQTFNATVSPSSVQTGARTLTVTVSGLSILSGETALICVSKGTEVYETKTISGNGSYTFPVNAETTGTMYVTVTAHNYKPVEKTVLITTSTAANLLISSVNFVDNGTSSSIGNSNGQNDAGETVRLQTVIKNNGATTATGLTATLTCNSDSITVLSGTSSLSNIASGSSVTGTFLYQIHKNMHETLSNSPNPVTFQLQIASSSGSSWTKTFNIDVFATELQQRNKIIISPANGNIGTNTSVTFKIELQNLGQAPATGLTAVLTSPNASSCSSTARIYPTIGQFETKTANTNFQFTTNTITNPTFNLTVTNAYGKTWTFATFNLIKPDTVTDLKSSAKERSIALFWNVVSGANGYNIYRCNVNNNNVESGSYVKINSTPVTFRFFNDTGLNALTKYYYKVTAVSSTGMESNPVRLLAWTSYPTKGLYPVTMDLTGTRIESHWVAEDINSDGTKEIISALSGKDSEGVGVLIALDREGKELFDIDNNVTTYSGFADLSTSIQAGVAVGDINQDGVNEIISLTRGFENNYADNLITCHVAQDSDGNNKPDILWQNQTQRTFKRGAIIENLDNSTDGSMEIVTIPCGNSNDQPHTIEIYNAQGNLIQEISLGNGQFAYSAAAVADLDGDGDKEIIAGLKNGIYVWHHDGTPFGTTNPFYSIPNYRFGSSPLICDINNDGEKDILLSVFPETTPSSCRILAINTNGQTLSGWGTIGTNNYISTNNSPYTTNLTKEIAVGDLNGDGNLEVVAVGKDCIKIWNNDGTLFNTINNLSGLESQFRTPVLADIDGDSEIEIIVTSFTEGKIHGLKRNGSSVLGFPLETAQPFQDATPVIADLDNNGKSEIVAGTGNDRKIYIWETNGHSDRIEWGSARRDARNTGEYRCRPTVIQTNTVWNTSRSLCNDLIIESGTLTINSNANVAMDASSTVIVKKDATLHLNQGNLSNCNVRVFPGGNVILQNNSQIKLRNGGEWDLRVGAKLDVIYGDIIN